MCNKNLVRIAIAMKTPCLLRKQRSILHIILVEANKQRTIPLISITLDIMNTKIEGFPNFFIIPLKTHTLSIEESMEIIPSTIPYNAIQYPSYHNTANAAAVINKAKSPHVAVTTSGNIPNYTRTEDNIIPPSIPNIADNIPATNSYIEYLGSVPVNIIFGEFEAK
jgi:hypothetical protein